MARATAQRPVVPFIVDGFTGMRDQRSAAFKPGEMLAIYNMMPEVRDRPSKLVLRPGYKRFCPGGGATAAQVTGGWNLNTVQFVDGFIGGVHFSLVVTSTGIWRIDEANKAVSNPVTAANVATAGADISGLTRAVFYNQKLIVATTGGKPWSWDGTSGAGGITVLANAPSGIRDVTVYSGKLMLVGSASPFALYWSEEGDETIGYATAPYSNFWTVQQTSQNPLWEIVGTNDGLFFLRANGGCGFIRGEVDQNFRTTSTKDELSTAVASAIGNSAARATLGQNGCVLFFDRPGKPMLYRPGKGLVNLWEQVPRLFGDGLGSRWDLGNLGPWNFETTPREPDQQVDFPVACYYDTIWRCHVFVTNVFGIANAFLFDSVTDRLLALWVPPLPAGGVMGCLNLELFGGPTLTAPFLLKLDGSGFLFWQDYANETNVTRSWSDETSGGVGAPVLGTVIGPPHGHNATLAYWWDRLDVLVEARGTHTLRVGWVTSQQHKGALTAADQVFTETGLANTPYQRQVEFGLPGMSPARWLMPQIQVEPVAGTNQQLGIYGYRLEARPDAQALGAI